jgi:hypothetical protein
MRQGIHATIRDAVLQRLDMLDRAADADPSTLLPLARTEITRIAEGWRLLLTVHRCDEEGRCQACSAGNRGRRWPCQVWRTAYAQLIGEGLPHGRTRTLRNPIARAVRLMAAKRAAAPRESSIPESEITIRFPPVPAD